MIPITNAYALQLFSYSVIHMAQKLASRSTRKVGACAIIAGAVGFVDERWSLPDIWDHALTLYERLSWACSIPAPYFLGWATRQPASHTEKLEPLAIYLAIRESFEQSQHFLQGHTTGVCLSLSQASLLCNRNEKSRWSYRLCF